MNTSHEARHSYPEDDAQHPASAEPVQAADSGGDSPYPGNYEENPRDDEALRRAAEAVPVKDYSDYEIEIETKTEFADALFGSDDDLDQALEESAREKEVAASQPAPKAEPEAAPAPTEPAGPVYDFSVYQAPTTLPGDGAGINGTGPLATVATDTEATALVAEPDAGQAEPAVEQPQPAATEDDADKPLSLAEKIKQKARQQFDKSRAHFDEYLGRSLPERELPLEFTFPLQKSKKEFDNLASGYSIRKLFEDKGKSILSVFRQADQDLAKVNKCQMLGASRHSLLDNYAEPLAAKLLEIITAFERKPSLASDSKRLQLAEHADAVCKHLILGYKQVYAGYYEAANVIYGPQRNSANAVVSRLFDMLLLEARLCFALHTQVPASSIKAINKLFTALRLYEPAQLTQPYTALADGEITSIKAMYFLFQVLLGGKGSNLSPLLFRVVIPYLKDKLPLLHLREGNETGTGQYWIISHEYNDVPRLSAELPSAMSEFAPTVIDVGGLFNAIKRDYSEALQHRNDTAWKPDNPILAAIKPHYSLTLLAGLNESLAHQEGARIQPNYSIYQPARMRSFSGLAAIIAHLDFSHALATRKPARKGEMVKDLPERPKADKASWRKAREEADTLYMQLDEAETTAQIDVGQLLLLIEIPEAEAEQDGDNPSQRKDEALLLTLVHRVTRPQAGKLNLELRKLSTEMTHARVRTAGDKTVPVLLALDGDGLLVITDHTTALSTPFTATLPDDSERTIAAVDACWLTTKYRLLRAQ